MRSEIWICNARLVDGLGNPPIETGSIAVAAGRIVSVGAGLRPPDGATVLDAGERTLLPGLINLHSHLLRARRLDDPPKGFLASEVLRGVRNARDALAQGITTTRDLGAREHLDLQLRDLIDQGVVSGPRLLASGRPITRTGGHNCDFGWEADGPDRVRGAVRAELKAGADVIKVMASWGGVELGHEHRRRGLQEPPPPTYAAYSEAEMRAAVEEAHDAGRRVAVHAESSPAVLRAVSAGVDSVEHGIHLTEEAVAALAESGAYLVPTISTVYRRLAEAERGEGPSWGVDVMYWARHAAGPWMDSLRRAIGAGVRIAVGTDAGGDILMEMQLMVEAGLSPLEAIRASTGRAAEALGRPDLGALEVGRRADLILVEGRPEEDLGRLARVWRVFKEGVECVGGGI